RRHRRQGGWHPARGVRLLPQPRRQGPLRPGVLPRRCRPLGHPLRRYPHAPVHRQGHGGRQLVRGLAPRQGSLATASRHSAPPGRVTRVAVFTAVDLEARSLARLLGLARVAGSEWPHYRTGALELLCVGPRARALDLRASRMAPPAFVVSAGVCGALSPDLAEGDLVVPEIVVGPTGARHATAAVAGLRRVGTLVTVDGAVATPREAGGAPGRGARARPHREGPAAPGEMNSAMRNGAGSRLVSGHPRSVAAPRPVE